MPKVGSKAYPYTPKGKAQAKIAKAKASKSKPTTKKKGY
tara:strand:+ start:1917 stop:2033 length:117 start_codon:yes stop_codon:yes gene_type:complete